MHRSDVHEIVILLSLGLLLLWTIGPFAFFIVYLVPPLRRFLDSKIPLSDRGNPQLKSNVVAPDKVAALTFPVAIPSRFGTVDSFNPFDFLNFDIFDFHSTFS